MGDGMSKVNWNTWKKLKDKLCRGEYIENFKTLQDAKKACVKSLDCGCISALTGDAFLTAKGTRTMRHEGGTAYVRRDGTKACYNDSDCPGDMICRWPDRTCIVEPDCIEKGHDCFIFETPCCEGLMCKKVEDPFLRYECTEKVGGSHHTENPYFLTNHNKLCSDYHYKEVVDINSCYGAAEWFHLEFTGK